MEERFKHFLKNIRSSITNIDWKNKKNISIALLFLLLAVVLIVVLGTFFGKGNNATLSPSESDDIISTSVASESSMTEMKLKTIPDNTSDFDFYYAKNSEWFFTCVNENDNCTIKRISLVDLQSELTIMIKPTTAQEFDKVQGITFYGIDSDWVYVGVFLGENYREKTVLMKISYDGKEQICLYEHNYYEAFFIPDINYLYVTNDNEFLIFVVDIETGEKTRICDVKDFYGQDEWIASYLHWGLATDNKPLLLLCGESVAAYISFDKHHTATKSPCDWLSVPTKSAREYNAKERAKEELLLKLPQNKSPNEYISHAVEINTVIYYVKQFLEEGRSWFHDDLSILYSFNLQTGEEKLLKKETRIHDLLSVDNRLFGLVIGENISGEAMDYNYAYLYEFSTDGEPVFLIAEAIENENVGVSIEITDNFIFIHYNGIYGGHGIVGFYNPVTNKY